jgi:hypothetical protein
VLSSRRAVANAMAVSVSVVLSACPSRLVVKSTLGSWVRWAIGAILRSSSLKHSIDSCSGASVAIGGSSSIINEGSLVKAD